MEYDNTNNTFTIRKSQKVLGSSLRDRRAVTHNVFCVDNKLMVFGGINGTQNQTVEYLDLNPNQGANGRA